MITRLLQFLDASPVNFLAVKNIADALVSAGYRRIDPQMPIGKVKAGDKLYVTKVDHEFFADTFIRDIDKNPRFKVVWTSEEMEDKGLKFRFLEYRRRLVEI